MYGIKEIDAATLARWLGEGRAIRLLDVRSPAEFAQGAIPGGELTPLHLLPLRAGELDPGAVTVLYCRSGARSAQACMFLQQQIGMQDAYNLRGGIIDWVRQGHPVVRPDAAA